MAKEKDNTPPALRIYRAKRAEAEQRLSRVFLAFVPDPEKGSVNGHVFYGSSAPLSVYGNENFSMFFIGQSTAQLREAEGVLQRVESEIRKTYSEKDFHSTVAVNMLSQYGKAMLKSDKEPQALAVEYLAIDCGENVITMDYAGDYTGHAPAGLKGEVLLLGAYDMTVRKAIMDTLTKHMGEKADAKHARVALKALHKVFGFSYMGYHPISKDE